MAEASNSSASAKAVAQKTALVLTGSPYDFSRTDELIEKAAKRTEEWLAEGGLQRHEIPHEMNAHKHH
jgi:NTE family protein